MSSNYQSAIRATPPPTRVSRADITTEIARGMIKQEAKARAEKTERLRALRLANEAAEAKAAAKAEAKAEAKKK